ncbi:alkaline phosphatase [Erwinia sp. MYb375]|uniref:alkaline phosphatase n=1 Tax=unclassified Erwinia TaxID=2622719 RepID=UPI003099A537
MNNINSLKLFSIIILVLFPPLVSAHNYIFMIGDGMGTSYLSALRYYENAKNQNNKPTIFDSIGVGMIRTQPLGLNKITDSAAGGTALATGEKTENGYIGMSPEGHSFKSVLKTAKEQGLKTGVVVTSSVTDATPASFLTTNRSRDNQDEIAYSYIQQAVDKRPLYDILLGGGRKYFEKNSLIKTDVKKSSNVKYVTEFSRLVPEEHLPVIGAFAEEGLPFAIDHREPSLMMMTHYALQNLQNSQGFFLLVESSQIDWCGHKNDIVCALNEMNDFAETTALVKRFVDDHPDTLLVITADHSTGGLSVGSARGKYWNPAVIDKMHASVDMLSKRLMQRADFRETWKKYSDVPLNDQQLSEIKKYKEKNDEEGIRHYLTHLINLTTNTGWTTQSHTGEDIPIFAYGYGAEKFKGFYENTEVGRRLKTEIIKNTSQ